MDPLRLYVVFAPAFAAGQSWSKLLVEQFDALGMQRDELRFGVPVQLRAEPWGADQPDLAGTEHPRRIDLHAANRNCIVVLVDPTMSFNTTRWSAYVELISRQMVARTDRDLIVPVLFTDQVPPFAKHIQVIRDVAPALPADERARESAVCLTGCRVPSVGG